MSAPEAKKVKLSEEGEKKQTGKEQKLFENIIKIQDDLDKISDGIAKEEILAEILSELKEYLQSKDLYKKRDEIISQIDEFWVQCICNHPFLAMKVIPEDIALLKHLREVTCSMEVTETHYQYDVFFKFEKNDYLEDDSLLLSKSVKFTKANFTVDSIVQSGVKWKKDKRIVGKQVLEEFEIVDEKEGEKKIGKKRKREEIECESFFVFFEKQNVDDEDVIAAIKNDIYQDPLEILFDDDDCDCDCEEDCDCDCDCNEKDDDEKMEDEKK